MQLTFSVFSTANSPQLGFRIYMDQRAIGNPAIEISIINCGKSDDISVCFTILTPVEPPCIGDVSKNKFIFG